MMLRSLPPLSRACLLLVGLLIACSDDNSAGTAAAPPPPSVMVMEVGRIDIKPETEFIGRTEALDTVDLRARVTGVLTKRNFNEGEDVREGALLFSIERQPYEAAVDAATAKVAEARAELARARKDLERARTLSAQGHVSKQALDRAVAEQEQGAANIDSLEADLRKAKLDLGYTNIYAPFSGRIGRALYSVGNLIGPDSGVLATIVKLDPIYVVFNVSEQAYLDYRLRVEEAERTGRRLPPPVPRLKLANGFEYPHSGRFDFIDNKIDPTTGTIVVRTVFPNPDKLLVPGSFVTVSLQAAQPKQVLAIPQSAVQQDQDGAFALVVGADNMVEIRHIKTGARVGVLWEVLEGLNEGDRVVYEGIQKVRPGGVVAPVVKPVASPTAG